MKDRLGKIKVFAMDVDGTLTDGAMTIHNGEQIKTFNVYDGLGIRLAIECGLHIAWITLNPSNTVADRAKGLGVEDVYQSIRVKSDALRELAEARGVSLEEIAYIGDDLNDLPAFSVAGFKFAPVNAVEEVKERADFVTYKSGGSGAVREAIEMILKARGQWEDVVAGFLENGEAGLASKVGPEIVM